MRWTRALASSLVIVLMVGMAWAEKNGLEQKPVLGWSSWSFLGEYPTAAKMEAQAQALRLSGLQEIGYNYVNLDDWWYECPGGPDIGPKGTPGSQGPNVGRYGRWVIDPSKFPPHGDTNGIKAVADYVHSLGMKFGIYVTAGISRQAVRRNTPIQGTPYTADQIAEPSVAENNYNCGGMVRIDYHKPGAQEYINSWADMLASWGVDYVKIDGITDSNVPDIKAWSHAIAQSGRPMVLDVTQGSFTRAIAPALIKYANQWEAPEDIECYTCETNSGLYRGKSLNSSYPLTSWSNVQIRFNYAAEWQPFAGPGGFNDFDSIEVGNGGNDGLTPAERKTQISLWALGASPLILGVDLSHLNRLDLNYLKNPAVLAVDQDSIAATRIVDSGDQQIFAKMEPNGDWIVGLFNTGESAEQITIQESALGLPRNPRGYSLSNLWTGEMKNAVGVISAVVPAHGVALYRVRAR